MYNEYFAVLLILTQTQNILSLAHSSHYQPIDPLFLQWSEITYFLCQGAWGSN